MTITLKEYLTASGSYPDRQNHKELTPEFLTNAERLLKAVNGMLDELGIKSAKVSSGFRPSEVNARVKSASKKSLHMQCLAIDILDDKKQTLATMFATNADKMRKYGLWLESPVHTKGQNTNWVHTDVGNRTDRTSRIFIP